MRTTRLAVVLLAISLTACHSGTRSHPDSSHRVASLPNRIGRLQGTPIDRRIGKMNADHAQLIRFAIETVPKPLPREATPFVQFLADEGDSRHGIIKTPPNGKLRNHYVVAAPGSNTLQFNLVCLRNFEQVACAPSVRVWQVSLSPLTMVEAPIEFAVHEGDRLDFLVLIKGDLVRPFPASQDSHVAVGVRRKPASTLEAPRHDAVLGGCDLATIQADAARHKSFRPPGEQPLSRPLFLIVQPPCDSNKNPRGEVIRVVGVVDRTNVVVFPGLESPLRIIAPAVVEHIPHLVSLRSGSELQIVVFRERLPAWITHPVKFVA